MRKIITIVFFALFSCGGKMDSSVKIIDFDEVKKVSGDLLIEKVVPLESDSSELLGEFLKTIIGENGLFVMNYNGGKGIHHFSLDGKHLGIVAEVGEAPGHVRNIKEFRISKDELLVMSNNGNSVDIHSFSEDHFLTKTTTFPVNAFTFYPTDNSKLWFYSGFNWMAGDHRLIVLDSQGSVKKKLLANDFFEEMLPIDEQSFFEGFNRILFREPFKSSIYKLTEADSLEELMRFDFGSTTVPQNFWEMETFKGFEMISKSGFSDINFIEENEGFLFADIITQKEKDRKRELYVWRKSDNKELVIEIDEDLGYLNSPFGLKNDKILFIAYAPYLIRNIDKINMGEEVKLSIMSLTEDSNPVIIYAKIPE